MATYNRTVTGGGTVGHPGNVARPYVVTSPVYDAVDNTSLAGDDIVQLIDLPADSMVIGGCLEVLEASGNAQITLDVGTSTDVDAFVDGGASNAAADIQFNLKAAGGNIVTSADTVMVTVLDAGSSGTTALRFRVHAVCVDISRNPTESATVSTGT
jgi:hypothetical protein|tara:strand:+ start:1077 stop:1544 length:468 start_codon:yes stop_codon:yes gene_type:complete